MIYRFLLVIVLIICTYASHAQRRVSIFYDSLWALNDKQEATYFRNGWLDTTYFVFLGPVMDFYGDGQLEMKGKYVGGKKSETFTFYYHNGQKKMEGQFVENEMSGVWEYFYPDGSPKQTIEFTDEDFKILSYHDPGGTEKVKDGNGLWESSYYSPKVRDTIYLAGSVVNGYKDDWWTFYNQQGVTLYEEKYHEGKFKQGKQHTQSNILTNKINEPIGKKLCIPHKILYTEKFIYSPDVMQSDYPYLVFLPDEKTVYFDQDWKQCEKGNAVYYRKTNDINIEKPSGTLSDYYINDSIYRSGRYVNNKKNGIFTYYHKNGEMESSGRYESDEKNGEWQYFYSNGNPRQVIVYQDDQTFIEKYWDEQGMLKVEHGTGKYQAYYEYNSISLREEGNLQNYQREGTWIGFTKEGELYFEEQYHEGKLIKGNSFDASGNKFAYTHKITKAKPAGGLDAFYQFVGKNLKYPDYARKNNLQGKVFVLFKISKAGELISAQTISSPHEVLSTETERVVNNYNHWKAGKEMGQAVQMSFVLSITFSLSNDDIQSSSFK